MKSIKNLTRFTYETSAFQGWRLSLSHKGGAFCKYFSDSKLGGAAKSFAAAKAALEEVRAILSSASLVEGKHKPTTIRKVEKLLKDA